MSLLILVVDDEPDVEALFRQQFRRDIRDGRFTMDFAQSGDSALKLISDAAGASLILILSDINMPGMTGLELLPKAKAARPDVPVIMITAYGDTDTRRKALECGAEALLTKPIDFVALRSEIDNRVAGAGAEVRSGSKTEKLNASKCFPLCTLRADIAQRSRHVVSCQKQTIARFTRSPRRRRPSGAGGTERIRGRGAAQSRSPLRAVLIHPIVSAVLER
jgi:CheY-like chemotaxis protein